MKGLQSIFQVIALVAVIGLVVVLVTKKKSDSSESDMHLSDSVECDSVDTCNIVEDDYYGEGNNNIYIRPGLSIEMIFVEGEEYTMGYGESTTNSYGPEHVEKVGDFYIGKTEVTQALWNYFMKDNPSEFKDDNRPVENVSWDDAQVFIGVLNEYTGKKFRLPTEEEWEFAARGGKKDRNCSYSGSDNSLDVAWTELNSKDGTQPVARKQPNELGIYDMSGNVMEWCSDFFSSDYNHSRNYSSRVIRGGSWGDDEEISTVYYRCHGMPYYSNKTIGFRLAMSK